MKFIGSVVGTGKQAETTRLIIELLRSYGFKSCHRRQLFFSDRAFLTSLLWDRVVIGCRWLQGCPHVPKRQPSFHLSLYTIIAFRHELNITYYYSVLLLLHSVMYRHFIKRDLSQQTQV